MVELRKRPAPAESAPPAKKQAAGKKEDYIATKSIAAGKAGTGRAIEQSKVKAPQQGETITLAGFGGEVEDNEGNKHTLADLVAASKSGVVLFTYPKASTPGCTTQACLFRDSFEPLTATGLAIYGLSTDSPKANTTFKNKHSFPYLLLCDSKATLIQAIGLKKSPTGTQRGVFVVDKTGKVLAAEPGSPAGTVEFVKKLVARLGGDPEAEGIEKAEERAVEAESEQVEDEKTADTAAEVAETAAKIDAE